MSGTININRKELEVKFRFSGKINNLPMKLTTSDFELFVSFSSEYFISFVFLGNIQEHLR